MGQAARAGLPDPGHPGHRRPPRPPRLAAAPAFRPSRTPGEAAGPFGWMVEARSLRVALNAPVHALPRLRVFAPAEAEVERRGGRRDGRISPAARASPAGWWSRRRAATRRCARAAGIPGDAPALRPDRHRLRRSATSSRTTTRRWSTSCRPARSRNCRCARTDARRGAARLRHRLDRARRRWRAACWRWTMPRFAARDRPPARRPSGRGARRRPALELSARRDASRTATPIRGWRWSATPRTAIHPIAGQGLNLGFRDADRAGRAADRGVTRRRRSRRAGPAAALPAAAPAGQPADAGGDRCARSAVQQRQSCCAWRATSASPRCTARRR